MCENWFIVCTMHYGFSCVSLVMVPLDTENALCMKWKLAVSSTMWARHIAFMGIATSSVVECWKLQ